jgi:hypothetical protein
MMDTSMFSLCPHLDQGLNRVKLTKTFNDIAEGDQGFVDISTLLESALVIVCAEGICCPLTANKKLII